MLVLVQALWCRRRSWNGEPGASRAWLVLEIQAARRTPTGSAVETGLIARSMMALTVHDTAEATMLSAEAKPFLPRYLRQFFYLSLPPLAPAHENVSRIPDEPGSSAALSAYTTTTPGPSSPFAIPLNLTGECLQSL